MSAAFLENPFWRSAQWIGLFDGAAREAKCPYTQLLRHHCPLPAFMWPRQRAAWSQPQAAVAVPVPPVQQSCQLNLDLDFDFDSQPSSPANPTEAPELWAKHTEGADMGGAPAPGSPLEVPAPAPPPPQEGRPVRAGAAQVPT